MKKTRPNNEDPLPKDKPASYGNEKPVPQKDIRNTATRKDKGISRIKSDSDSPQKVREKIEYDHQKKEQDPGMTKR